MAHLQLGNRVTDAGLAALRRLPAFQAWADPAPRFHVLSNESHLPCLRVNMVAPITDAGLQTLRGLEGLAHFELFGSTRFAAFATHANPITTAGVASLADLPNLLALGCAADKGDDATLAAIATFPVLRYLSTQETVATDAGFAALARSASLEHLWALRARHATQGAIAALAALPTLKRLAIGGPHFAGGIDYGPLCGGQLEELVPIGAGDAGFGAIDRIASLRALDCMFCDELTDAAFLRITDLRLERVSVFGTSITDRTLHHLARMDSLQEVHLEGCRGITPRGVAALEPTRQVTWIRA